MQIKTKHGIIMQKIQAQMTRLIAMAVMAVMTIAAFAQTTPPHSGSEGCGSR